MSAYLDGLDAWTAWRTETDPARPGEKVKIPYATKPPEVQRRRGEGGANVWVPRTRLSRADADALAATIGGGVGFVFACAPAHDVFCLDMDGCRDPATGLLAPEAIEIIEALASYTEVSPSQEGVKVFFRSAKAAAGRAKEKWPAPWRQTGPTKKPGLEFFARGGYCTVTGQALGGMPAEPREVAEADVLALVARLRPAGAIDPGTGVLTAARPELNEALSDDEVLETFRLTHPKLYQRWYIDNSRMKEDESAEDFELAAALARVVGGNPDRVERLMRRTGIEREKWARGDYMRQTIGSAVTLPDDRQQAPAAPPQREKSVEELAQDPVVMTPPVAVVPRLAWVNRTTLLAGREKWAGKSTLLTAAAAAVTRGGMFLGEAARGPGDVLWCSADLEPEPDVVQRFLRFGGDPRRMFLYYPSGTYDARLAELDAKLRARAYAWLVVDTVAHFALVEEASQAGGWIAALIPLRETTQRHGVATTLVHHSPKSASDEYRDSTAIGGAVDMIMIYQNPDRASGAARRKMIGSGRVTGWRGFETDLVDDAPPYFALRDADATADVEYRQPVLDFVGANPRCNKTAVSAGVSGNKALVHAAVDALKGTGELIDLNATGGRNNGRTSPAWALVTKARAEQERPVG